MPGLFVTATGTDVGKTFIVAGLLRAGRRAGLSVGALKPVLSGYSDATAAQSDAGVLLAAMGQPLTAGAIAEIAPWRFAAPLAPNMAAALEERELDFEQVAAACRAEAGKNGVRFIEGVGGVMVPLDGSRTVLDLMAALGLPILLVTGSGLGAISHCLTAVTVLAARELGPKLIVLNETPNSTVPLMATAQTLEAFCPGYPLAVMPHAPQDALFDMVLKRLI